MDVPFSFTFDMGQAAAAVNKLASVITSRFGYMATATKDAVGSFNSELTAFYTGITSITGALNYMVRGVKAFEGFEKLIVKTGGLLNATKSQMTLLQDTAIHLGTVTEHSTENVANAMSQMALAGFSAKEIIGALPGLLGMATAGMVSIGKATNIASEILRTFQVEAKDMDYVAGALTTTFTTTNTTLGTLSYTMKYAGAQASQLGVGLSQVAAVAGVLGNIGVKGSMSGTGVRQFIMKLAAGLGGMSKKMAAGTKGLKSLGLSWKDISDKAGNLNLVKAIGAIGKALDKMGAKAAERVKTLRGIFGVRASSQIAALVAQGPEVLQAKNLEIEFGGAKQKLMGLIAQATELKEGIHGIKINASETATSFVTVGAAGRRNLARLSAQMRDLGLVGGFLNTQVGVLRERLQKVDGKIVRDKTFSPIQELSEGSLRAVDGLTRLKNKINSMTSENAKLKLLNDIFGVDPVMYDKAVAAFTRGGKAMAEFANGMIAANSAMDIQKKILDSTWGSLELLRGSFAAFKSVLGSLVSPIVRIAALVMVSMVNALMVGGTISDRIAEFKTNLGGLERFTEKAANAFKKLSLMGKALAIVLLVASALVVLLGVFATFTSALAALTIAVLGFVATLGTLVTAFFVIPASIIPAVIAGILALGATIEALGGAIMVFAPEILAFIASWVAGMVILTAITAVLSIVIVKLAKLATKLALVAYSLLPATREVAEGLYQTLLNLGSLNIMPKLSLANINKALPKGGIQVRLLAAIHYASKGWAEMTEKFYSALQKMVIMAGHMIIGLAAFVSAVVMQTIKNTGFYVTMVISNTLDLAVQKIVNAATLAQEMLIMEMQLLLQGVSLAVEEFFNALLTYIEAGLYSIMAMVKLLVLDLPAIILNGFLQLQALGIRFMGTIFNLSLNIFRKMVVAIMDMGITAIETVSKVMVVIATLPIALPYLAMKAIQLFINTFITKLRPGYKAIENALIETFNVAKETIKGLTLDVLNTIILPVKLAIIRFSKVVSDIALALSRLPSTIYNVFGRIVDAVLNSIAKIGDNIFQFMVDLPSHIRRFIIHLFNLVGDLFAGIVRNLTSFGVAVGTTVSRILAGVAEIIAGVIIGTPYMILNVMWAVVSGVVIGFTNMLFRGARNIKVAFLKVANTFIFEGIGRFISGLVRFFRDAIPNMIKVVRNELADFYLEITDAIRYVIYDLPLRILKFLDDAVLDVLIYLIELPKKIGDFFINAIEGTVTFINHIIKALLGFSSTDISDTFAGEVIKFGKKVIGLIIDFPSAFLAEIDVQIKRVSAKFNDAIEILKKIKWKVIEAAILKGLDNLIKQLISVFDSVLNMFDVNAKNGFFQLGKRFLQAIYRMFDVIINKFPWGKLWNLFGKVWNYFAKLGDTIAKALFRSIGRLLTFLSGGGLVTAFNNLINNFLSLQLSIWKWVWNMKGLVRKMLPDEGIGGVVKNTLLGLLNLVEAGARLSMGLMKPVIDWMRKVVKTVQDIIDLFASLWAVFTKLGVGFGDIFKDPKLLSMLSNTFSAAFDRLVALVPEPFKKIGVAILKALGLPLSFAKQSGQGIVVILGHIAMVFTQVLGVFASVFKGVTDDLLNNVDTIVKDIFSSFKTVADAFKKGGLFGVADAIMDLFFKVLDNFGDYAYKKSLEIFDGIIKVLDKSGPIGEKLAKSLQEVRKEVVKGWAYLKQFGKTMKWLAKAVFNDGIKAVNNFAKNFGKVTGIIHNGIAGKLKDLTGSKDYKEFKQKWDKYITKPIGDTIDKIKAALGVGTNANGSKRMGIVSKLKADLESMKTWIATQISDILSKVLLKLLGKVLGPGGAQGLKAGQQAYNAAMATWSGRNIPGYAKLKAFAAYDKAVDVYKAKQAAAKSNAALKAAQQQQAAIAKQNAANVQAAAKMAHVFNMNKLLMAKVKKLRTQGIPVSMSGYKTAYEKAKVAYKNHQVGSIKEYMDNYIASLTKQSSPMHHIVNMQSQQASALPAFENFQIASYKKLFEPLDNKLKTVEKAKISQTPESFWGKVGGYIRKFIPTDGKAFAMAMRTIVPTPAKFAVNNPSSDLDAKLRKNMDTLMRLGERQKIGQPFTDFIGDLAVIKKRQQKAEIEQAKKTNANVTHVDNGISMNISVATNNDAEMATNVQGLVERGLDHYNRLNGVNIVPTSTPKKKVGKGVIGTIPSRVPARTVQPGV